MLRDWENEVDLPTVGINQVDRIPKLIEDFIISHIKSYVVDKVFMP